MLVDTDQMERIEDFRRCYIVSSLAPDWFTNTDFMVPDAPIRNKGLKFEVPLEEKEEEEVKKETCPPSIMV